MSYNILIKHNPKLPKKHNKYLLTNLLNTNGNKKWNGFALLTASKHLTKFYIKIFDELNLSYHSTLWKYKDYIYHQIYIGKKNMLNY